MKLIVKVASVGLLVVVLFSVLGTLTGKIIDIPDAVEAATHKVVHYVPSVDDIPAVLAKIVRPNDLVITMGAGSINQYGPKLLAILEEGLQ